MFPHATIFIFFREVIDYFIPSRSLLLQGWDGGWGKGKGGVLNTASVFDGISALSILRLVYLLAIHISIMTGQLYCLKLQELHIWYTDTMRQITICGMTRCYRHFVTMSAEACLYNFTV